MPRRRKTARAKKSWAWKMANPLRYAWHTLKGNAKRRGKSFNLSYEDFIKFDSETDYTKNKGRSANDISIDRTVNTEGYKVDNIQTLTVSQNSIKGTNVYDDGNPCPF